MQNYHLIEDGDQWKLRKQGAKRSSLVFDTKQAAVAGSTEFMNEHGGSLKIHKGNGRIQEERTYPRSADPRKSKG